MSTRILEKTNQMTKDMSEIVDAVLSGEFAQLTTGLAIEWEQSRIVDIQDRLHHILLDRNLYKDVEKKLISDKGKHFVSKLTVNIPQEIFSQSPILGRFEVDSILASGRNSYTFKAIHNVLNKTFVLKVIRPGIGSELQNKLAKVGDIKTASSLVQPVDYADITIRDINGQSLSVSCLIFPYIEGETLFE